MLPSRGHWRNPPLPHPTLAHPTLARPTLHAWLPSCGLETVTFPVPNPPGQTLVMEHLLLVWPGARGRDGGGLLGQDPELRQPPLLRDASGGLGNWGLFRVCQGKGLTEQQPLSSAVAGGSSSQSRSVKDDELIFHQCSLPLTITGHLQSHLHPQTSNP